MVMAGYREGSMYKELKRVIPTAAFGGAISWSFSLPRVVGLLSIGLVNTLIFLRSSLTYCRATEGRPKVGDQRVTELVLLSARTRTQLHRNGFQ
jgi:hypothetical protein